MNKLELLRALIVEVLKEEGESLLNDDGVDEAVCEHLAKKIVDNFAAEGVLP